VSGHLSIGEVLAQLQDRYPDVTVSKIRFLESQGLIDPERTPSGYRKFSPGDVRRLRWILHQQKEHFLPLRVIRERLATLDDAALARDLGEQPPDGGSSCGGSSPGGSSPGRALSGGSRRGAQRGAAPGGTLGSPGDAPEDAPSGDALPGGGPRRGTAAGRRARGRVPRRDGPVEALDLGPGFAEDPDDLDDLAPELSGASLTRSELAAAAGIGTEVVDELVAHGLISAHPGPRGAARFDEDALAVANLAARFGAHGIEARHLKMYRRFAEREATLFTQAVLGLLRQRNPEARAAAREAIGELARLGRQLRAVHLRRAVTRALRE
jgi:DNA-binding transcriptional MerR regulator